MISDDPVWLVVMLGAIACVLSLGLVVSDVILPRVQRWRMRRILRERSRYVDPAMPRQTDQVKARHLIASWHRDDAQLPPDDASGYTTTRLQARTRP